MTSSEYRKLSLLLTDIKNGSREAFAQIYLMYEKKVYFLFCKLLKSKSLAKQMTIEFFAYIYLQAATYGNADTFEKWLYATLFSKCRRYLTDNQPEVFGDYTDTDSLAGDGIDAILSRDSDEMIKFPDGIDISVDMMQTVDSILSEIPLKLRIAVLQYYFCGFEFQEMAASEHISLMAVKNRLYKAHIRLETEEHKYSEIGYDCDGIVIFMPDVLSTMADSIVIPSDIASGVTSRTGVNCLTKANTDGSETAYINLPQTKKSGNYVTTKYARPAPPPEKSVFDNMTPTVKVLTAIVALLVIIGGTVAVVLAVQNNNRQNNPENTTLGTVTTTLQSVVTTLPETTTEPETTTVPETTTEAETTTVPETTTQPETTTKPETTTVPETTTEPETTTADTGNNEDDPANGGIDINENLDF